MSEIISPNAKSTFSPTGNKGTGTSTHWQGLTHTRTVSIQTILYTQRAYAVLFPKHPDLSYSALCTVS